MIDLKLAMFQDYGYIGLFLVLGFLFTISLILLPSLLRLLGVVPRKPDPVKSATYECGMETIGETWIQFNPRYYLYALLFVAFDVETIFLYPWAVAFRKLGFFGLVEMFIFILILLVGFLYAWRKGALEWR